MPVNKQYKCDGCGAEKGSTNHWWAVRVLDAEDMILAMWTLDVYEATMQDAAGFKDVAFFCGEACAIKKISRAMGAIQTAATDSQADRAK